VGVPIFNGEPYLKECLDSILAQTEDRFELVIVDDQSTDGSFDIAETYARQDHRIRLFRNERNLGLVGNWNRCVDLARADWIKFVFQDDFIAPGCLDRLLAVANPEIPLVVSSRDIRFESVPEITKKYYEEVLENRSLAVLLKDSNYLSPREFCRLAVTFLGENFVGEPSAALVHRSAFDRFGRFNAGLVQLCDFEYWVRIAMRTGLSFVREELATFRVHRNSVSATNEAQRNFRSEVLDSLILIYEFAYYPEFAPVRAMARRMGVSLKRCVAEKAFWAQRAAAGALQPFEAKNRCLWGTWNSVVADYPKLADSMHLRMEKLKHELGRRLLWRLNFKGPDRV